MAWTQFWDMHSGGGTKEEWSQIYIEAPEEEAVSVFYSMFGHNPHRVSCTCCGPDYSISEYETLEEASAYDRGDTHYSSQPTISLEEYKTEEHVKIITKESFSKEDTKRNVPEEGYVWV
jgi:hypothetical protein